MPESLLGGVLGGEDEKLEGEAPEARAAVETTAGAEAFAAAVAAKLSASDPEVAHGTTAFLKEQTMLLATQRRHLEDEHALRLEHLAHQRHLLRGQRLGQAIRLSFQIVIALVVIVIGAGIAVMLHDAFTSHNVVIDAFDAPAALAGRGVTGKVVAGDVLDELTRLQSATVGAAASLTRNVSGAWSNQVTVQVPETGITLGELSQVLKARFGHDVHIDGALVETASGGLALSVRGDGVAAKTFTGSVDALRPLAVEAAQYVYAQSEPASWAAYLEQAVGCPEAVTFIRSIYETVDPQYRAPLLTAEAECSVSTGGSLSDALALLHQAQALDPDYFAAYDIEQYVLMTSGHEEAAWRVGRRIGELVEGQPAELRRIHNSLSYLLGRDFTAWRAFALGLKFTVETRGLRPSVYVMLPFVDVGLHDPGAAESALRNAPPNGPQSGADIAFIRALIAAERGNPVAAAQEVEATFAGVTDPLEFAARELVGGMPIPENRGCVIAAIEESGGHPEKADAILANAEAAHLTDCQRFRGDILDHRGDWPGAQQAYAQAVALAPDLPAGYYSWGVALARHGDLAGAIAKLQEANQRGPHWADPLKVWGDVLAKQGHWSDALAKYDEALKYAPNWAALRQARDAARKRT